MGVPHPPRPASSVRPPDRLLSGWWNHCQAVTTSALPPPSLCGERAGRAVAPNAGWTPESAREWLWVFRDIVSVTVGAFMLIWQTVLASHPDPLIIGAGLVALGLPPALRIDERLRGRVAETQQERP